MTQGGASSTSVVTFDGVLVIVGGGEIDTEALATLVDAGAHLVGADGGADRLAAAGYMPELIVGDFDSLERRDWPAGTRLMHIAEQLSTDFEKAIYSTRAPVTVAIGMTGGRFDHTLAALDAVTRHAAQRRIVLVDSEDVSVALTAPFAYTVAPGERVSVHPLLPVRFNKSHGLVYPLDDLLLAPGVRTGTSNEASIGPFEIEPADASPWLLILPRHHLRGLIAALLAQQ